MSAPQGSDPNAVKDPREKGPQPPQPPQWQPFPGSDAEMTPYADHGEKSYQGHGKLTGRVALITGGDSGIGRAVAIAFAREGADVVISYLNEDKDAQETARLVTEAGRKAVLEPGDISDESRCQQIVERTVKAFGRLDILVNNAAFQMSRPDISDISTDEWRRTYGANVDAMFFLCKAAVPHMKPGASIINTSSVQAYQPDAVLLAYASTKGAIVNFTKGLAKMLGPKGIRVNSVAPGPVWTPLIPSTMPQEKVTTFGQETPLARAAQPAEVAPAFVLLASQDGSYITGAVLPVTGGLPTM